MLLMTDRSDNSYPSDICLMLRAHGEQLWLASQVMPVLRQVEAPGSTSEEEIGAALAYLEVIWIGATTRAAETDAALATLLASDADRQRAFHAEALDYHAAVKALREGLAPKVAALITPAPEGMREDPFLPPFETIAYAGADDASLRPAVALHAFRRRPARR
jgi:hypothetical protein